MGEKTTPVRVLHVLGKIGLNDGISSAVMNYYNKLDHSKLTFDFMLNEDAPPSMKAYIEGNGSKIYIMPKLKVANTLKYIKKLREFYKTANYKIIHGHVANSAVFYLGLARDVPHKIIHSHSTKLADIWWKRVRNWALTRFIKFVANNYIACSEEAAKSLFGKNNNALILNNAIDVEKFAYNPIKREEIRNSLGICDKHVIGHVGRMTAEKNHGFLLQVAKDVQSTYADTALLPRGAARNRI